MAKPIQALVGTPERRRKLLVGLVLVIQVVLVSPNLMPPFNEVNPWDEAKYVDSGRNLLSGEVRGFSWGTLVAFVYAPLHLVLRGSRDWFLLELWAGRFLLFLCLWLSTFFLSLQFRELVHPLVSVAILFVTVPFFSVLENQSDALFVALSAVGLGLLLQYRRQGQLQHLFLASIAVALTTLTRTEAILLVIVFVLLAVVARGDRRPRWEPLLIAILPIAAVLGALAVSTRGLKTFDVSSKAWETFVVTQPILPGAQSNDPAHEAARLFGTEATNQGSVLRAILRNPSAFMDRVWFRLKTLPDLYLSFFSKRQGPVLLLFAAWGAYALIARKRLGDLAMMVIWGFPALVALVFLARHVISQVVYAPLVLAAAGISFAFDTATDARKRWACALSFLALALFGAVDAKPAFLYAGFIVAAVFVIESVARRTQRRSPNAQAFTLLLLLTGGMILRGPFSFPDYPRLGASEPEQGVHFLQETFPRRSRVAVPLPLPAIAADMEDVILADFATASSASALYAAMTQSRIAAIYVDDGYLERNPTLRMFLEEGSNTLFDLVFASDSGTVRVFRVLPSGVGAPGPGG